MGAPFSLGVRNSTTISIEQKPEIGNLPPVDKKINQVAREQFSLLETMLAIGTVCLFTASILISSAFWHLTGVSLILLIKAIESGSETRKNEAFLERCKRNLEKIADIRKTFPQISAIIPELKTPEACVKYFQFIPQLRVSWNELTLVDKQNKMPFDYSLESKQSSIGHSLQILEETLQDLVESEEKYSIESFLKDIKGDLQVLNKDMGELSEYLTAKTVRFRAEPE